jgi:hypothetical protein
MNTISTSAIALALFSAAAYAQQPPDPNPSSDNYGNSAYGFDALFFLTPSATAGEDNTGIGEFALNDNTSGSNNTAIGWSALQANSSGSSNTAAGQNALLSNQGGAFNTATGSAALYSNVSGSYNTAVGEGAMYGATGNDNTAIGQNALKGTVTGSGNIAVGYEASLNVTTGSNNIEIGNKGGAGDNKVIKIGTAGMQTKAFIAGIYSNTAVSGLTVVVGSNGELGAVSSSERFKTAIAPMGSNTEKLQQLRPVTFRYKADARGTLRYGLIAEEVAKVYPELVVRDQKGRTDGVRYDEFAPMLLNEMQRQHATVAAQAAEIRELKQQVAKVNDLEQELAAMRTAFSQLQAGNQLVAQR